MSTTTRRLLPANKEIRRAEDQINLFDYKPEIKVAMPEQRLSFSTKSIGDVTYKSNMLTVFRTSRTPLIDNVLDKFRAAAEPNFSDFRRTNKISHSSLDKLTTKELDALQKFVERLPSSNDAQYNYKFYSIFNYWRLRHLKECFDQVNTEGLGTFLKNYDYKSGIKSDSKLEQKSLSTFHSLTANPNFKAAYTMAHESVKFGRDKKEFTSLCEHPKLERFVNTIKENKGANALVLVKYNHTAHVLSDVLNGMGINAKVLETNKEVKQSLTAKLERKQKAQDFKNGKIDVLIGTSTSALGSKRFNLDLLVLYGHTSHARTSAARLVNSRTINPSWGEITALVSEGTREEGSGRKLVFMIGKTFNLLRKPSDETAQKTIRQTHIGFEGLSNTDIKRVKPLRRFDVD